MGAPKVRKNANLDKRAEKYLDELKAIGIPPMPGMRVSYAHPESTVPCFGLVTQAEDGTFGVDRSEYQSGLSADDLSIMWHLQETLLCCIEYLASRLGKLRNIELVHTEKTELIKAIPESSDSAIDIRRVNNEEKFYQLSVSYRDRLAETRSDRVLTGFSLQELAIRLHDIFETQETEHLAKLRREAEQTVADIYSYVARMQLNYNVRRVPLLLERDTNGVARVELQHRPYMSYNLESYTVEYKDKRALAISMFFGGEAWLTEFYALYKGQPVSEALVRVLEDMATGCRDQSDKDAYTQMARRMRELGGMSTEERHQLYHNTLLPDEK